MKKMISVLLCVAAVLILSSCGRAPSTPEELVEKFECAINREDPEELTECFDSSVGADVGDGEYLLSLINANYGRYDLSIKTLSVEYLDGGRAKVSLSISAGDRTDSEDLILVIRDGVWYILEM